MTEIKIDEHHWIELETNGSVSFPHVLDGKIILKRGDRISLLPRVAPDAPQDRLLTASITHMSSPTTVGSYQVCALSVERVSAASLGGRLAKTLMGHHYELLAAFARSAAHKLPGSMGRLRENALAKFLQVWIPRRLTCPSNVFATHEGVGNFELEIDLAVYDSTEGPMWPLDCEEENLFLAYRHTKAVIEVKSTLDADTMAQAVKSMRAFDDYMEQVENSDFEKDKPGLTRPSKILFAYRVDADYFGCDFQELLVYGPDPFDLIVILGTGAYFADRVRAMAIAFGRKLTKDEARGDVDAINREMGYEFCGAPSRYRRETFSPDDTLMALIYALTDRCAGSELTGALLSALAVKGAVNPLYLPDPDGDVEDLPVAVLSTGPDDYTPGAYEFFDSMGVGHPLVSAVAGGPSVAADDEQSITNSRASAEPDA